MAAFSHQHHPFHLDSFLPANTPLKMSEFVNQGHIINPPTTTTTNCFSHIHPSETHQSVFMDAGVHESSCLSSKVSLDDNETMKQSTDSSSVMDRLDSGQQVTQKTLLIGKKRKNRGGSSFNSAQSKDAREGKGKKQSKCNGGEEKKPKTDKKDKKEAPEVPSKGYIHVRARRGQATDSHSLAERVRRERISERMKLLQALVPGCDKVTGKALMLDEIINYVQSLQNQVEFLSMKLASFNPMLYDFGMDLDAVMVRPERLSSMASPLPSGQLVSPTSFLDHTTTTFTTTPLNEYPMLDSSLHLQQRPNVFSQENGSLLWDIDGQSQKFINQFGTSNGMCSFN